MDRIKFQQGWYVVYTKPRHEKKINDQLCKKVKTFLPLTRSLRKWSDRKKWVETPLFASYLFVYLEDLHQYNFTLGLNGVYTFIKNLGQIVQVPEHEISRIKYLLSNSENISVANSRLKAGDFRKINFGPLAGLECKVVRCDGRDQTLVQIDSLNQVLKVDIKTKYLETTVSL